MYLFVAALLLSSSVFAADEDRCRRTLAQWTRFPQEASVLLLRSAIAEPSNEGIARDYADTLDQDFTPTARQAAEAQAIRLAIAIQNEGGYDNPFHKDVYTSARQRYRLTRHPRGVELIGLWTRAGWAAPLNIASRIGFVVRNGLPRSVDLDWVPGDGGVPPLGAITAYISRLPSVTMLRDRPRNGNLETNWFATEMYLASLGHLGLQHDVLDRLRRNSPFDDPYDSWNGEEWREVLWNGIGNWWPGQPSPYRALHASLAALARAPEKDPLAAETLHRFHRWLAWLEGAPPAESDFFERPEPRHLSGGDRMYYSLAARPLISHIVDRAPARIEDLAVPRFDQWIDSIADRRDTDVTSLVYRWLDTFGLDPAESLRQGLRASRHPAVVAAAASYRWRRP